MSRRSAQNKKALDQARKKKAEKKLKQQKKVNKARRKIQKRKKGKEAMDDRKQITNDAQFEQNKTQFEMIVGKSISDNKIRFYLQQSDNDPMKAVQLYFASLSKLEEEPRNDSSTTQSLSQKKQDIVKLIEQGIISKEEGEKIFKEYERDIYVNDNNNNDANNNKNSNSEGVSNVDDNDNNNDDDQEEDGMQKKGHESSHSPTRRLSRLSEWKNKRGKSPQRKETSENTDNKDDEIVQLRSLLGSSLPLNDLKTLLLVSNNDVSAAANTYFEELQRTAGGNDKRQKPLSVGITESNNNLDAIGKSFSTRHMSSIEMTTLQLE